MPPGPTSTPSAPAGERTYAHTRGNSYYHCKPTNYGTSPSMQPTRKAIPRACIRSGRALAPSLSNRVSAFRLKATAFLVACSQLARTFFDGVRFLLAYDFVCSKTEQNGSHTTDSQSGSSAGTIVFAVRIPAVLR